MTSFLSTLAVSSLDEQGLAYSAAYAANKPFPHIVLDSFFSDELLTAVVSEFPPPDDQGWKRHRHQHSEKLALNRPERFGPMTRSLIAFLGGPAILSFLEQLTGMEGLMPDPYLEGGGLHQITTGGFLGIHADFNHHPKLHIHRRLNLLIYLNDDWREEYGSHLELWDSEMKEARVRILPVFNRTVVFSTTDDALHGHPDPLRCPDDRTRKSLALYYYTANRPDSELSPRHSTIYKQRPGHRDTRKSSWLQSLSRIWG